MYSVENLAWRDYCAAKYRLLFTVISKRPESKCNSNETRNMATKLRSISLRVKSLFDITSIIEAKQKKKKWIIKETEINSHVTFTKL